MTQYWDPESYAEHARFVSDLGAPVVDLLAPQAGERILDLGCGDGALTERFRNAGCLAVGVDSSPEQVWAALQRGLDARIVDARELPFDTEFDAVFSNAALHWIPDPDAAIDGVWKALKPGGRFVAECGGAGCVASIRESFAEALRTRGIDCAGVDPWYFPTADQYRARPRAARLPGRLHRAVPAPDPAARRRRPLAGGVRPAVHHRRARAGTRGPPHRDAGAAGAAYPARGQNVGRRLRPPAVRRHPAVAAWQPLHAPGLQDSRGDRYIDDGFRSLG